MTDSRAIDLDGASARVPPTHERDMIGSRDVAAAHQECGAAGPAPGWWSTPTERSIGRVASCCSRRSSTKMLACAAWEMNQSTIPANTAHFTPGHMLVQHRERPCHVSSVPSNPVLALNEPGENTSVSAKMLAHAPAASR